LALRVGSRERADLLPVFRVSRALGIGREAKAFLNMHAGLTRGVVPDPRRHEKQAAKLRKVVSRQKKALRRKDRQLEEQAATLRILRESLRRKGKLTGKVRKQRLEIFRLRNELDAMNGLVENAADVPSAARASEKPGVGAPSDFVIIGTQKDGTSLLYRLLTEHTLVGPPLRRSYTSSTIVSPRAYRGTGSTSRTESAWTIDRPSAARPPPPTS
jgi:hypothetical protein